MSSDLNVDRDDQEHRSAWAVLRHAGHKLAQTIKSEATTDAAADQQEADTQSSPDSDADDFSSNANDNYALGPFAQRVGVSSSSAAPSEPAVHRPMTHELRARQDQRRREAMEAVNRMCGPPPSSRRCVDSQWTGRHLAFARDDTTHELLSTLPETPQQRYQRQHRPQNWLNQPSHCGQQAHRQDYRQRPQERSRCRPPSYTLPPTQLSSLEVPMPPPYSAFPESDMAPPSYYEATHGSNQLPAYSPRL